MGIGQLAMNGLGKFLGETPTGKNGKALETVHRKLVPVRSWDEPVICFPQGDFLTLKDLQFTHILGTTGSGKTSMAENIASVYLTQGFGGLVLTDKADEYDTWVAYAKKYGREDDLVIFSPEASGLNFLDYAHQLFTRAAGGGVIVNLAELFLEIAASQELRTGGAKGERFWTDSFKLMMVNALYLLTLSRTEITLEELQQIIQSAPDDMEAAASEEWRTTSKCFAYIAFIQGNLDPQSGTEDLDLTQREIQDFERVVDFWLKDWAGLSHNTRSCIQIMFANMAQMFLYGTMADAFCSQTTVSPDLCREGKIILLALPIEHWHQAGQYAQILFKLLWQKAMKILPGKPVFLWVDEASGFIDNSDAVFLQTARSHQCCYVLMSQTLAMYFNQLPEKMVKALIENFNLRLFLASGDPQTNAYAADCIAKSITTRRSMSMNAPSARSQYEQTGSTSETEQLEYKVLPEAFTRLKMGGKLNRYLVGSYLFRVGRKFKATRDNHLQIDWPQRFLERGPQGGS